MPDGSIEQLRIDLAILDERLKQADKALVLQGKEYERRLHDLNGEYKRDRDRQQDYVTIDKYEDKLKSEAQARDTALLRIDEKFDDYVKRYEQRQREVDQALTIQKTASDTAQRFAEAAAADARAAVAESAVKANVRIGGVGLVLAAIVIVMNLIAK